MRTKITILSAAALAAGLLSSQAQVYSANVVGYVNISSVNNITPEANPLLVQGTPINAATNVIPNVGGAFDGLCFLSFFLPSGVLSPEVQFDSSSATGFSDPITSAPVPTPIIPIGTGFFLKNNTGAPFTNTFVGEVQGWNSATLTFSNSITVGNNFNLVASPLPLGGQLDTTLQLTNVAGAFDGLVFILTLTKPTTVNSKAIQYDSSSGTGFSDVISGAPVPAPVFAVGDTFYIQNNTGAPFKWEQKLP